MTDILELALLGNPQVTLGGEAVTGFRSSKAQALLYYLASARQAQPRTTLASLFWGDLDDHYARRNLSKTLSNLRQLFPDHMLIDRQTAGLIESSGVWLDVAVLEESAQATGGDDLSGWEAAADLVRGEFLEGFYVHDAPEFEQWVLLERTRLRRAEIGLLERMAQGYLTQNRLDGAIQTTQRILDIEPWREEAHRQMMHLLARTGQRSAALTQFRLCRRALAEELDAQPDTRTLELVERIRSGEFDAEWDTTDPAASSPTSAPANPPTAPKSPLTSIHTSPTFCLPPLIGPFIGRQRELAQLTAWLDDPSVRLVVITGPGGIGKTRLAMTCVEAVAARSRSGGERFGDGIFVVSLAPLSEEREIVSTLAETLDFRLYGADVDERPPVQQIAAYLQQKRVLLVLDNFEHLLNGAELLSDILEGAPHVAILVTSRERLYLRQEQLLPLRGLETASVAASREPALLLTDSEESDAEVDRTAQAASPSNPPDLPAAEELFVHAARRVRPGFALNGDRAYVAQICDLVDGMPLAIELAASWVDKLSCAEIALEIKRGLDILETEARNVPQRHRSIRAAIDASWNNLTPAEQETLARLSVFRGGFTRQAAQEIALWEHGPTAALRFLSNLVNKSLLRVDVETRRYQMHELVRQYSTTRRALDPEADAAIQARHADHYAALLQRQGQNLHGNQATEALARLDADSENIAQAWTWHVEHGNIAQLDLMADPTGLATVLSRRHSDGVQRFVALSKMLWMALPADPSGQIRRLLARSLGWQARFGEDPKERERLIARAFTLLDDPALDGHDVTYERALLHWLAGWIMWGEPPGDTLEHNQRSLDLFRQIEHPWGIAHALLGVAASHFWRGAYQQAAALYQEALAANEELGAPYSILESYSGWANSALCCGELALAEEIWRKAVRVLVNSPSPMQRVQALEISYMRARIKGRFEAMVRDIQRVMDIYRDLGRQNTLLTYTLDFAISNLHLGDYVEARRQVEIAQANLRQGWLGGMYRGDFHLHVLAMLMLEKGEWCEAASYLDEAVAAYEQYGQRVHKAGALAYTGIAAHRLGHETHAKQAFFESLQICVDVHGFIPLMEVLLGIALLLADTGEVEEALAWYALAVRHPSVGRSKFYHDIAGQFIKIQAATLDADAYESAWERGETVEMWPAVSNLLADLRGQGWEEAEM